MLSRQKREVLIMATFTNDQIRKIFALRSKGKSQKAIADFMGCSDSHISNILLRRLYPDVEVMPEVLEKCKGMKSKRTYTPVLKMKPTTSVSTAPPIPLHEALANYTATCHQLKDAKQACMDAGVCGDTLELLRESVRNGE